MLVLKKLEVKVQLKLKKSTPCNIESACIVIFIVVEIQHHLECEASLYFYLDIY